MKKHGGGRFAALFTHFEYPENLLGMDSDIVVSGGHTVSVSGVRGILLYRDGEIALRTAHAVVRATGRALTLERYNGRRLEIHGEIDCVRFERGGEGEKQ